MKKIAFLFFFFIYFSFSAQTQDLFSLAKGDYLGFNALFDDDDNLYGYVAIYGYGKSGEKTKKFEYVILDKNLNPVANKEFEGDITAGGYFGYIDFRKKIILFPYPTDYSGLRSKEIFEPRSMEIDMATNTIKQKIYYDYENGKFTEIAQPKSYKDQRKENKAEKREKGYNYVSHVFDIKEGGYLVFEYHSYGTYTNNETLMRFDENKKPIWTYKYNVDGNKKNSEHIRILEKDDNNIYALLTIESGREKTFYLQVLNMKTGEIIAKKQIIGLTKETLERITSVYSYTKSIDNDKTFDDKIVILGKNYFNTYEHKGFVRLIIDKKTLSVETKQLDFLDFKEHLPDIDLDGKVESGYYLDIRDFYCLEDGSIGILFEKLKPEGQYSAPKTTDMVYVYTDKDFKVTGLKVFKKEKTKWAVNADYLFSQYLNQGKDVVFFYRDLQKDNETKQKNWNLYINTLINGQFKQENVQISEKDNYMVIPYVGKEGYILLREYNEKEKFNKVRLERLNY